MYPAATMTHKTEINLLGSRRREPQKTKAKIEATLIKKTRAALFIEQAF